MALLLDNDTASRVLEMADAVEAIDSAFTQLGAGNAAFYPLAELVSPTTPEGDCYTWGSHIGAVRDPPRLALRFKSDVTRWESGPDGTTREKFNVEPGTYMGVILLFDTTDGALLAVMNDGVIQHARVGATAGVACDHLARDDAQSVGMLGSGGMARVYLEAFDVVRELRELTVYSPTPANRQSFAEEAAATFDIDATAVDDPAAAIRGADIAATCTNASQPVFDPAWLEPGQFVVNVRNIEVTAATIGRADRAIASTNEPYQTRLFGTAEERASLESKFDHGDQETAHDTLGAVLAGEVPARQTDDEVIFFDNRAAGIQFAAVGDLVYRRASDRGLGTVLPLDWFQQAVKN
jgi:ornithine cyclodeaminase/alanine dehydrogenase-like protein (mu-crystallin family)